MLIIEHGKAFLRCHYGAGEPRAGGLLYLPKWWEFRRGSLIVPKRYASREVKLVGEIDVEHGSERDDERGFDRAIERASGMRDGGWIYRKWGRTAGRSDRPAVTNLRPILISILSVRHMDTHVRVQWCESTPLWHTHIDTRAPRSSLLDAHAWSPSLPLSLVCPRLSPLLSPLICAYVGTLLPRDIRHRKSRCVARWAGHPKSFTPIWTGGTIYSRHDNWPIKTGRERSSYLPSDNYTVSSRRFDHVSTRPGVGGGDEWRWERVREGRRENRLGVGVGSLHGCRRKGSSGGPKGGGWNRLFRSRGFGFYGVVLLVFPPSSALSPPPPSPRLVAIPGAATRLSTRSLAYYPPSRKSMRTARPFLNLVTHDWNTPWCHV